jgi:hypothetical protein
MKYRKILYLIVLLGLVGTICHLYFQNKKKIFLIEQLVAINKQNSQKNESIRMYKNFREIESTLNGKELSKDLKLLDEKGDAVFLKDIITGNRLVMRYSELNCQTCIDTQLENLNNNINLFGVDNVVLFTTSRNRNYIRQFRKVNRVKFKIYNLSKELERLIPDIDMPYYFLIDEKSMRINCLFIPQKELLEQTNDYIENIKLKFY